MPKNSKPFAKLADIIIEESVLSSKARENLSASDFCGPDRSYPAHDKAHAQNCLARAAQNKASLGSMYSKVVACCRRKLKHFGGEVSESMENKDLLEWYIKQVKGE